MPKSGRVGLRREARARWHTPKPKLSLGAVYETSLGNAGDLAVGVNYVHQTRVSTAQTNASFYKYLPGDGLLNATLDLKNVGGRPLDIGVFANTITNVARPVGVLDFYNASPGTVGLAYTEPRMSGVRVGYRFGNRGDGAFTGRNRPSR